MTDRNMIFPSDIKDESLILAGVDEKLFVDIYNLLKQVTVSENRRDFLIEKRERLLDEDICKKGGEFLLYEAKAHYSGVSFCGALTQMPLYEDMTDKDKATLYRGFPIFFNGNLNKYDFDERMYPVSVFLMASMSGVTLYWSDSFNYAYSSSLSKREVSEHLKELKAIEK